MRSYPVPLLFDVKNISWCCKHKRNKNKTKEGRLSFRSFRPSLQTRRAEESLPPPNASFPSGSEKRSKVALVVFCSVLFSFTLFRREDVAFLECSNGMALPYILLGLF
jgi:hypothetical protein